MQSGTPIERKPLPATKSPGRSFEATGHAFEPRGMADVVLGASTSPTVDRRELRRTGDAQDGGQIARRDRDERVIGLVED